MAALKLSAVFRSLILVLPFPPQGVGVDEVAVGLDASMGILRHTALTGKEGVILPFRRVIRGYPTSLHPARAHTAAG